MGKAVVYQLLVRLFGNSPKENREGGSIEQNGCGKFNDINDQALSALADLGVTHVWVTGVIEHAKATSYQSHGIEPYPPHLVKGKAGSPYAIVDYYDVDPDLAVDVPHRMEEFAQLVHRTHQAGLKLLIDFVPNHVARFYNSDNRPAGIEDFGMHDDRSLAFSPSNNFYYLVDSQFQSPVAGASGWEDVVEQPAKVTGNDCLTPSPSINDWYETVKLNYGVDLFNGHVPHFNPIPDTWHKMVHVLLYWAEKGVDGFRCDMAEMVPVSFWNYAIRKVKETFPDVLFVAEVYNPNLYNDYIAHGCFDWLYDKVGMYDTVRAVVQQQAPASRISSAWEAVASKAKHMLFFMENHDEQRVASSFFAGNAQKGWPGFFVSATLHANPVMLYFGQELGVDGMEKEGYSGLDGRTTIFDYWSVAQFQRWANHQRYDGEYLDHGQRHIRQQYRNLLMALNQYEALASGAVYDLLYANAANARYDTSKLAAYLRYTPNSVVWCLANFTDQKLSVRAIIPDHAFERCGLPLNGYFKSADLLGTESKIQFPAQVAHVNGVGVEIGPYQTLLFKLK